MLFLERSRMLIRAQVVDIVVVVVVGYTPSSRLRPRIYVRFSGRAQRVLAVVIYYGVPCARLRAHKIYSDFSRFSA